MSATIFPQNPAIRLVNAAVPDDWSVALTNPILIRLPQFVEFGWQGCTPQSAGQKILESLDDIAPPQLAEHAAHAKRFVEEHITAFIDGKLPDFLRPAKYVADVVRIIRWIARVVATLKFIQEVIRKAIMLAQKWAQEADALLTFLNANLSPAALRNRAEREVAAKIAQAKTAIAQKVSESTQGLACFV